MLDTTPFVENILVLGDGTLATALTAEMKKRRRYRVLDPQHKFQALSYGTPHLVPREGRPTALPRTHRIVVALGTQRSRLPVDVLLDAKRRGIAVEDGQHCYERLTGKLALDQLQADDLLYSPHLCDRSLYAKLARLMSVAAALVGVIILAPLMALLSALIKWDSSGPVLFVQERIGKDGRTFPLMKFRTMRPTHRSPSEWVRDNGDRITAVGRWMRKYRLDELPQLFNVLRGDMNVIGPRPHPSSNYRLFLKQIPLYAFRTTVLPGITGWAQVRYGYANDLQEEIEKMRYDLYYIKHRSWRLDVEIVLRTFLVILLGREAPTTERPTNSGPRLDEQTGAA